MAGKITKAVVTGASGFIGTALCSRLISSGVQVHAVSRNPPANVNGQSFSESPGLHNGGFAERIWWKADVTDLPAVRDIIGAVRPDVTYHLASLVTGARSLDYVLPTFRNNFLSALNVLTASAESGSGRVVLANSFEEPDAIDPTPCSPYAAAKSCTTTYARMFHKLYQVPVVVAQIYMVYGPGQIDHAKLVPYVTRSLLRGEPIKLSSGVRMVDWVYIDDLVDGLIRCGETQGIDGSVVALGSGEMHSVREVVERLCEIVKSPVQPEFGALPDRPLERIKQADVRASAELIGWSPRTSLEQGLCSTADWYRQQMRCELRA